MSACTAVCVGSAGVDVTAAAERAFRPTLDRIRSRASETTGSLLFIARANGVRLAVLARRYPMGHATRTNVRPAPPARGAAVMRLELLLLRLLLCGLLGSLLLRGHFRSPPFL